MNTSKLLASLLADGFDLSRPIGRDDSGRFTKGCRVRCSQCDAATINGVPCHETGCRNTPRDTDDDDDCESDLMQCDCMRCERTFTTDEVADYCPECSRNMNRID